MNRIGLFIVLYLLMWSPIPLLAATGRILDEKEAKQADTTALAAEASLFKSIGQGIALSLAQCEGQSSCNPAVSKDELVHLLETLDKRINDLVARQEQKQGDYTEVMTAYVNQREAYRGYQADLEKFTGGATGAEDLGKDTFGETPATGAETPPAEEAAPPKQAKKPAQAPPKKATEGSDVDLDVFSDVDEKIE